MRSAEETRARIPVQLGGSALHRRSFGEQATDRSRLSVAGATFGDYGTFYFGVCNTVEPSALPGMFVRRLRALGGEEGNIERQGPSRRMERSTRLPALGASTAT